VISWDAGIVRPRLFKFLAELLDYTDKFVKLRTKAAELRMLGKLLGKMDQLGIARLDTSPRARGHLRIFVHCPSTERRPSGCATCTVFGLRLHPRTSIIALPICDMRRDLRNLGNQRRRQRRVPLRRPPWRQHRDQDQHQHQHQHEPDAGVRRAPRNAGIGPSASAGE